MLRQLYHFSFVQITNRNKYKQICFSQGQAAKKWQKWILNPNNPTNCGIYTTKHFSILCLSLCSLSNLIGWFMCLAKVFLNPTVGQALF